MQKTTWKLFLLASLTICLKAQTRIDLSMQSRNVDFSNAESTRPLKTGTTLPATCRAGEAFFLLNAAFGTNVYWCIGTNVWSAQSSGGSGSGSGSGMPMPGAPGTVLISTDGASIGWTAPAGDLSSFGQNTKVIGIQNWPVSAAVPQSGQALIWNAIGGQWEPGSAGGLTVKSNGVDTGMRSVQNFVAGMGLSNTITDTGTAININQSINTAVVQTHAAAQSGSSLFCASQSGSATIYVCSLMPTLTSYTTGMVLRWKPDVNAAAGAVTLNVDALGAVQVKRPDGMTDPAGGDIVAGKLYSLWYDGAVFRLPESGAGAPPVSSVFGRLGTIAAQAGDYSAGQITNVPAGGLTSTTVQGAVNELNTIKADAATVQTRALAQSAQTLACVSSGVSGGAYTCAMTPALAAYTPGMVVYWRPDTAGTGATTLNVNGLGARPVRRADGVGNPLSGDIAAGRMYALWFDGTAFRLPSIGYDKASWGFCAGQNCVVNDGVAVPYIAIAPSTIAKCYIAAKTAPVGSDLIVDIQKNGVSVFGAQKLVLPAGQTLGSTVSFSAPALAEGDTLTTVITQVGATTPGKDVSVACKLAL